MLKISNLKNILFFLFLSLMGIYSATAQTVTGKWYSIDSDTNKKESIIEIYKENNKIYGKIIRLLKEEDKDKVCDKCTGKDKGQPIEGLVILRDLTKDGEEWNGGKILDPKNGSYYKCYIIFDKVNKLKIRGYMGFSLIGRTEYWYRVID